MILKIGNKPYELATKEEVMKEVIKQMESTKKEVIKQMESTKKEIFDKLYPVGSVYISLDATFNPNNIYNGKWELQKEGIFIEATQVDGNVGKETEAGAPNITGKLTADFIKTVSGSFFGEARDHKWRGTSETPQNNVHDVYFDASKSSAVYGKSKTIQPYSVKAKVWKRAY